MIVAEEEFEDEFIDDDLEFDDEEQEVEAFRMEVDGIQIAFKEANDIVMTVEGHLPEKQLNLIIDTVSKQLSAIENVPYQANNLTSPPRV